MRAPNPMGCRWCGIDERPHARQWTPPSKGGPGWHAWEQPTQQQLKERMLAGRTSGGC